MSIDTTLAERGERYGNFADHADITQGIKDAMKKGRNWDSLKNDQREALEMAAHKFGRILNGDPDYIDSWHDIIGYVRLVEQRLAKEQSPKCQNPEAEVSAPTQAEVHDPLRSELIKALKSRFGGNIEVHFIGEETGLIG